MVKLLQKIYFLNSAKKTCKPNNHDLNRDWNIIFLLKKIVSVWWIKSNHFGFIHLVWEPKGGHLFPTHPFPPHPALHNKILIFVLGR